jgi:hypothetical protein
MKNEVTLKHKILFLFYARIIIILAIAVILKTIKLFICLQYASLAELYYFLEPGNYDEIPLCKILYFVRGTALLVE